jgi:hypothetical protein
MMNVKYSWEHGKWGTWDNEQSKAYKNNVNATEAEANEILFFEVAQLV